jgi:hypothetical protein
MLARALKQGEDIAELSHMADERMRTRRDAPDRVLHYLQDYFVFNQSQNPTGSMVFNIPSGHAFEAVRFMIFPEVKSVTTDVAGTGPDDLVYRPTDWASAGVAVFANSSVDALVEFSYTAPNGQERKYQNKPFFVAQCFSSPMNVNMRLVKQGLATGSYALYAGNQYGRGLEFDPFLEIMSGTAISAQVTTLYSGNKQTAGYAADSRQYEYRIRGVFEGYKRVLR